MSFAETWTALNETTASTSESRRRIEPDSKANIWLLLKGPLRLRTLRIEITEKNALHELPHGSGIDVELYDTENGAAFLEVSLSNKNYSDVFDVLLSDLVTAAVAAAEERRVGSAVAERIKHWQAFLKSTLDGLSPEALRGLYGELKVLHWIGENLDFDQAVRYWVGPEGYPQDFHIHDTAIEVKTSAAKNPQSLLISSERQLDGTGLSNLFLWHWSVDERLSAGESLPNLIDEIRSNITHSFSRDVFEDRLLSIGYLDIHAERYHFGFAIRSSQLFDVKDDFPRLVESDCPSGVGGVSYSLQLGAMSSFAVDISSLLERFSFGSS